MEFNCGNCNEKDKLIKWVKENNQNVKEIYKKNIEYMNYLNILYDDFLIFCYLHC